MRNWYISRTTAQLGTCIALALAATTASAGGQRDCYYGLFFDADKDGYARNDAYSVSLYSPNDLHCPAGYVPKKGDCNDFNAAIHPRADDFANNGIDDNCATGVGGTIGIDEPLTYHSPTWLDITTTGFTIVQRINSKNWNDLQPILGGPMYVEARIESLRDTLHPKYAYLPAQFFEPGFVSIRFDGLKPTTAYRVQTRFVFCLDTSCSYSPWSEYYYSTTTGTTQKSRARTEILLKGFQQLMDSNWEQVGYRGKNKVDGTRYGADPGEMWCSEFYSWVTNTWLNWHGDPPSNIGEMVDGFARHGGLRIPSEAITMADRGDYVALDSNNDGTKNHSAMILAWDAGLGKFWTLEGNSGNEVAVNQRPLYQIFEFGHITYDLLR